MYELTPADFREISNQRKQKRIDRYGDYMVLALALPYIDSDKTLVDLLHLNH